VASLVYSARFVWGRLFFSVLVNLEKLWVSCGGHIKEIFSFSLLYILYFIHVLLVLFFNSTLGIFVSFLPSENDSWYKSGWS
jgi:hypothetical protein